MSNKPMSRRERPSKPALSRDGIIAAALKLFYEEGLEKVTMRRIAGVLDTGPASLYVYVRDTEDLHAQILDALLETIPQVDLPADWRGQLKGLLRTYLSLLFDHPALARMAMSTMPNGPNYLAFVERLLQLLSQGAVPDSQAAWGVDLLLLYATAQAVEKTAWRASSRSSANFVSMETALKQADAKALPNITRLGEDLLSGGSDRLEWGFDVLINGILQTQRQEKKQ